MIKQDSQLATRGFSTRQEASTWVAEKKKEFQGQGTIRHSVKENLHDPNVKWVATIYIRGTK